MRPPPDQRFGIRRAAHLSGLHPAMVDYLCRSNVLIPSARPQPGRGRSRIYTFGDIVMLRALSHLLSCGISVAKLKKALGTLRSKHDEITVGSAPMYLVTDGNKIYFRNDGSKVIEELSANGQMTFAFVIKLREVQRHVVQALGRIPQGTNGRRSQFRTAARTR
jgi:DNA-binding transcriptional MerR regulator